MIEFKRKDNSVTEPDQFERWPTETRVQPAHFHFYIFRINGIEYKVLNNEFKVVYEPLWMWEQISD